MHLTKCLLVTRMSRVRARAGVAASVGRSEYAMERTKSLQVIPESHNRDSLSTRIILQLNVRHHILEAWAYFPIARSKRMTQCAVIVSGV